MAQAQIVKLPEKKRGNRKPWEPARFATLMKQVSSSVRAVGNSYVRPANPQQVPRDAPGTGEWSGLASDLLKLIPRYKNLYENWKKAPGTRKGGNGGLEQHVYLSPAMTQYLNGSGILGNTSFPVDQQAGGLGIATRALFTSAVVAITEAKGLKHPTEKKYIAPDAELMALIGEANFDSLKNAKPKKPKANAKKPKKHTPPVATLERDGREVLHFSFDAIPSICKFFIINLPPRGVTPQQTAQIDQVRTHLKALTVERKKAREEQTRNERAARKAEKMQNSIVPTTMMTLKLNTGDAPAQPLSAFNPTGLTV